MRWKKTDKTEWHKVFALWPVTTVCNTVVWLEYVEYRDGDIAPADYGCEWVKIRPSEYRLIKAGDKE